MPVSVERETSVPKGQSVERNRLWCEVLYLALWVGQSIELVIHGYSAYFLDLSLEARDFSRVRLHAVDVFNDVNATDWFADSVRWAYRNDIMNGVSQHTFSPNNDTSRAMVATMLWRMEGSPVVSSSMAFADVADGTWYTDAVRWVNANGIITGYTKNGEKVFNPDGAVTREQLATMLYRYAQYKGVDVSVGEDTNILSYGDSQNVSEYAVPAMQWACGAGIITGYLENGTQLLGPNNASSRAVVATMLMRYFENTEK